MDQFSGLLNDKFGGAGGAGAPPPAGGDMGGGMPDMPKTGGADSPAPSTDTSGSVNWDEMPLPDAMTTATDGLKIVLSKLPKGDVSARLGQIVSDAEAIIGDVAQAENSPGADAQTETSAPTDEGLKDGEKPPTEVDLKTKDEKKKGPNDQFDLGIMPA